MSITKLEVRPTAGGLLTLLLGDISNGFALEDVGGLDPVKATLVSSSFANFDGSQYQSARRENRNILLTIELLPDYITQSVRALRTNLYQYLMPKTEVQLRFYMADGLTVNIMARVESFETALFSKEPTVNVSLVAFDPDFTELTADTYSGNSVADSSEFTITYAGSVETGILFTLNLNRSLSEVTVYHRPPDGVTRTLDFQGSMVSGDKLEISTVNGSKYANLTHSSVVSSALYGVSPQSTWLELQPGDNHLRVYAVGAAIPFTIDYITRHGGL
jgi:tail protein